MMKRCGEESKRNPTPSTLTFKVMIVVGRRSSGFWGLKVFSGFLVFFFFFVLSLGDSIGGAKLNPSGERKD